MRLKPEDVWQTIAPAGSFASGVDPGQADGDDAIYRAALPDGRLIALPIRALPGSPDTGVASLIVNQASFEVLDALAGGMAGLAAGFAPDVVVGVPTLGLALAPDVARRLGHPRYVPLGTSRKFWYDDALSEPLASITTPGQGKSLYIDPRLLPLLVGQRVVVVDDVISTGRSMSATLRLLARIGCAPEGLVVAMRQSERWRPALAAIGPGWPDRVRGVLATPLLARDADGRWHDAAG